MDNKIRIYELAKQLKSTNKKILEMLNEMGIKDKTYMSVLEGEDLRRFYEQAGVKADKANEPATDDTASKKIAAQKEQQTQGKSSGVIVRRIIVDNSSDSDSDRNSSSSKRQSREASSGLRAGYAVRTESADEVAAPEKKETAEKAAPVAPAKTEPTVRRVKRVKKEDIEPKAETPATEVTSEKPAEEKITAKDISKESVETKTETTAETKKEKSAEDGKFVFKQYEYSEVITIELENKLPEEPVQIFNIEEPKAPQRPQRQPVKESRPARENRDNHRGGSHMTIPPIAPNVAMQEVKRDYAGKMAGKQQERETDKYAKKDSGGRKDFGKNAQNNQKDKYKSARKFVGEKMGVSEIYSDDYGVGYDIDNMQKKGSKGKKDMMKKAKEFVAQNQKTQPVIAVLTNVTLPETMTVKDFAERIKKTSADVIKKLMLMGVMANQNQVIDFDTAALIASEYNITAEQEVVITDEDILFEDDQIDVEKDETAVDRPPVVVVMGHVDHGKTSLLDAIRKTSVTSGEAGGITQHIGAYMVRINDRKITFLDTPGHEAFTAMRARGAQVTDVAIIVVAADDGVMPQTVEAINHAKAANVSIVVAVNKIDKPGANIDRVTQELAEHDVITEAWGGDVPFVPVSAKSGENIELLLETVLLSADILQLKASPERLAKGTIIEAKLDKNRGPVATLLVQRGTLKVGDAIVSGTTFGRIRTMTDDKGNSIKKATPSTPIEITGLPEVPEAGELFYAAKDEKVAKHLVDTRKSELREKTMQSQSKVSLDDLFAQIQEGNVKDLNIIVKADVMGSVEAVKQSLVKLSTDEVKVKIVHGAVGGITETDVQLASVSNAIIIGFNVRPGANVAEHAAAEGVDIRTYRVIYDAIEDVKAAMAGLLDPEFKENVIGHVEVRQTFKVSGVGTIAGCYVTNGKIVRNSEVRIVRDGIVVYEGKLASLKRFKDDAKEVQQGFECGLSFEKFNDIKEGDNIECYVMEEVKRNG